MSAGRQTPTPITEVFFTEINAAESKNNADQFTQGSPNNTVLQNLLATTTARQNQCLTHASRSDFYKDGQVTISLSDTRVITSENKEKAKQLMEATSEKFRSEVGDLKAAQNFLRYQSNSFLSGLTNATGLSNDDNTEMLLTALFDEKETSKKFGLFARIGKQSHMVIAFNPSLRTTRTIVPGRERNPCNVSTPTLAINSSLCEVQPGEIIVSLKEKQWRVLPYLQKVNSLECEINSEALDRALTQQPITNGSEYIEQLASYIDQQSNDEFMLTAVTVPNAVQQQKINDFVQFGEEVCWPQCIQDLDEDIRRVKSFKMLEADSKEKNTPQFTSFISSIETLRQQLAMDIYSQLNQGPDRGQTTENIARSEAGKIATKTRLFLQEMKFTTPASIEQIEFNLRRIKQYEQECQLTSLSKFTRGVITVICAAVGFVVGALIGAAIGVIPGLMTGPGAFVTGFLGAFKGSITGAALGATIGGSVAAAIVGVGTGWKLFKPKKFTKDTDKVIADARSMYRPQNG